MPRWLFGASLTNKAEWSRPTGVPYLQLLGKLAKTPYRLIGMCQFGLIKAPCPYPQVPVGGTAQADDPNIEKMESELLTPVSQTSIELHAIKRKREPQCQGLQRRQTF